MAILRNLSFLFVLTFLLSSCASKYAETDLHGKWEVKEWKEMSTNKVMNGKMDMDFDANGQYNIAFDSDNEKGKYWLMGEFLHTIEEGQSEKKVKIMNLTSDSLVLQMNRGGEMEKVILLKK